MQKKQKMPKSQKQTKFIPIGTKITFVLVFMLVVPASILGFFSYTLYRNDAIRYNATIAQGVAVSFAATIDVESFVEIVETGEKTPYQQLLQANATAAKEGSEMSYFYGIVKDSTKEYYRYIFIEGVPGLAPSFGDLDLIANYGEASLRSYDQGVNTISDIYHSEGYSSMVSGYAPIKNADGEVVGIVGADIIMDKVVSDLQDFRNFVIVSMVLFCIIIIIGAHYLIKWMIGRPIEKLSALSKAVAIGELDEISMDSYANDEIGSLAKNIAIMQDTLSRLVTALSMMMIAQQRGDFQANIKAHEFEGMFNHVATGINDMVNGNTAEVQSILSMVTAFSKGDFDSPFTPLPGKKMIINETIEKLRKNFKEIHDEIAKLTDGDLSKTIDATRFEGNWADMIDGLNQFLADVIAPIKESATVLTAMSHGDFSARIQGEYKGDFGLIKTALNETQDTIASYISEISRILHEMSSQNFTVKIDREYIGEFSAIKEAINNIITTLSQVLSGINASAIQVSDGTRLLTESGYHLSQGSSTQASAVAELTSIIENVSEQTQKNADLAAKANILTQESRKNAQLGNEVMGEMLAAMDEINESSSNISKIIKVIEDIAFQTSLLALNAAIEAARAGEHGKSFGVVADEVRNLASKSQAAAQDTTVLIVGSVQKSLEGTRVANETAKTLELIAGQISEVSGYISDIADASKNQSASIEQINGGIQQVYQVTQMNISISQENAASVEELSTQADLFRSATASFKLPEKRDTLD